MNNTTSDSFGKNSVGKVSRRKVLFGGGVTFGAVGLGFLAKTANGGGVVADDLVGREVVPFYGKHQAGIATVAQSNVMFVAFEMLLGQSRDKLIKLMKLWTDDAARLSQGVPALADSEPEMAQFPGSLTFTFGFGSAVFEVSGLVGEKPVWLEPLPVFGVDSLVDGFSGGDLFVQICGNHELAVFHALRVLVKDALGFAKVSWVQRGFRSGVGVIPQKQTMRNLMGQLDGSSNLVPGTVDFERLVWCGGDCPSWLLGGSSVVLRRIFMDLDGWDELDRGAKEQVVGRRLFDGAPLTGGSEFAEPDFGLEVNGLKVIPDFSHIRRAHFQSEEERFFRRGYNYDEGVGGSGLLFCAYQADVLQQFLPVQRRLDKLDLLNQWTVPVGSAVFVVLPGCYEGGYLGQSLLEL